jgi:hypothetical protein
VVSNELDGWISEIDSALSKWSQGDCTIGDDCWFVTRFDPQRPVTIEAKNFVVVEANTNTDLLESQVRGFVVVTQTCDLVRACAERAFVEVSPLVAVNSAWIEEIRKLKRPRYAYIVGVADRNLVADLVREAWALPNRVMTVEKAVVAAWERIPGCQSDADIRVIDSDRRRG